MSTINYTVTVADAKFLIDGAVAPKLTFRDGDTYVFDQADSSNSGQILQFSITSNNSGSAEYTTGVTKAGTPGNANAKTTIVTSGSTTDTLYFYSSGGGTYGEEFSNSGFNTSTNYNFLKPVVGGSATAEKWGSMVNHTIDQIDQNITAQDLDFQGDSGGALSVDLDSESLTVAGGTGLSSVGSSNTITVNLDDTAVTPNSYGSASLIPAITVDAQGRITAASTAAISSSFSLNADAGTTDVFAVGGTLNLLGGTALTSTVSNDTVTFALDDDSIDSVHYKDFSIDTIHIANDAVTEDKLANTLLAEIDANTAKVTNVTHTGDVAGTTALTIQGGAVDIAMLSATGTASSSTFLRGDNTWVTPTDTDTNTTYSAGTNMSLSGTTFSSTDTNTIYSAPTIGSTSIGSGSTNATIAGLTLTSPVLGVATATSLNGIHFKSVSTRNIGVGLDALNAINGGSYNTAFGERALYSTTTGIQNTGIGYNALGQNTDGMYNFALGDQALVQNISGDSNMAIGNAALGLCTGHQNTAIGNSSMYNTTGSYNVAIGKSAALSLTTGSSNITIGTDVNVVSNTASNQLNIGNTIYGNTSTGKVGIGSANTSPAYALSIPDSFGMVRTGTGAGSYTTYITHASSSEYGSAYMNVTASTGGYVWQTNGTKRLHINSSGHITPGADNTQNLGSTSARWGPVHGRYFASTPIYSGSATGFPSGATINTYYDITVVDFASWSGGGGCFLIKMSWNNINTTYGYTVQALAIINSNGVNTHSSHYQGNVHWQRTNLGDNGGSFNGVPCYVSTHTSSSALTVNMMLSEEQNGATYPPLSLHVKTNASPTSTPQIKIYRMVL